MKDKKIFNQPKNKVNFNSKRPGSGETDLDESTARYKEILKKEKSIDMEVCMQNLEKVNNWYALFFNLSRFYMAILAGCLSGTLCLTGLYGIAFYLLIFFLFSILLFFNVQFKKGTYFLSNTNIFTHGMFTQIMVNNF